MLGRSSSYSQDCKLFFTEERSTAFYSSLILYKVYEKPWDWVKLHNQKWEVL